MRTIRRVSPRWEHPRYTQDDPPMPPRGLDWIGEYKPLIDETFDEAMMKWYERLAARHQIGHKRQDIKQYDNLEDDPVPSPEDYRPEWKEDPTWWQMYEDISEGTPFSPAFATKEELIQYLVFNGDFGMQEASKTASLTSLKTWPVEDAIYFVSYFE